MYSLFLFQKLASPAASLSPVKHDISTNHVTLQTWDSPSIVRAGSTIQSSPSRSETASPPKNPSNGFLGSSSVKNHDIYRRLTQNNNNSQIDSFLTDDLSQSKSTWNGFGFRRQFNTSAAGEGDSPKTRENVGNTSVVEDSDGNNSREVKVEDIYVPNSSTNNSVTWSMDLVIQQRIISNTMGLA